MTWPPLEPPWWGDYNGGIIIITIIITISSFFCITSVVVVVVIIIQHYFSSRWSLKMIVMMIQLFKLQFRVATAYSCLTTLTLRSFINYHCRQPRRPLGLLDNLTPTTASLRWRFIWMTTASLRSARRRWHYYSHSIGNIQPRQSLDIITTNQTSFRPKVLY